MSGRGEKAAINYFPLSVLPFVSMHRLGLTEVRRYLTPHGKTLDCIILWQRTVMEPGEDYREYAVSKVWVYTTGGYVRVEEDA